VISGNDSVAMRFMTIAAEAGLSCPRDYSIIGFDAEPAGRLQTPPLTSYRQPLVEMGQAAVSLLISQLTEPRQTSKLVKEFPLEFVAGASLGPVPRG
jgi:LacI family transcriptional regulator